MRVAHRESDHNKSAGIRIRVMRWAMLLAFAIILTCNLPVATYAAGRMPISRQVSLPRRKLKVIQFEKVKLVVKRASGTVLWSTSDKKVAGVTRNGIVRTKKPGKCRITASVDGKKYVCHLTVRPLKLSKTELTMVRKRQAVLSLNNQHIQPKWSSSDEEIAVVNDSGLVQALKEGTCEITAAYKTEKLTCQLTVTGISRATLHAMFPPDEANSGKILLAGSSSMDYWNGAPQAFAPYEVLNMAIGGTIVGLWSDWCQDMIAQYRPSAVVIYVGSNDIRYGGATSGEENASNTILLLKKIRAALKNVPVFYVGISPCWSRKGGWEDIAVSNALVKNYCGQDPYLYYIDIASACAAADGTPDKTLFLSDQLHPSPAGYRVWKKVVAGTVKKVMKKKTARRQQ